MPKISDYIKPTEKQKGALRYIGKGYRIFYGGARGGGKSWLSLAAAVLCSLQYPGLKTVCLKKTYPELEDVFINNLRDKYPEEIFGYKYKDKTKTATFSNGSRIIFKAAEHPSDAQKIHGLEYQLMIIDEANNYPEITIHKFSGSLRNAGVANFVPTLLMTGNPGGFADLYFKTRFINPDYKYWTENEQKYKDRYIFVSAMVEDNPYINPEYIEWLDELPEGLRQAWRFGSWTTFQGQFFEEWNENIHVVEDFTPPKDWERKGGIDLGFTKEHPTVVLWAAQNPKTDEVVVYKEYVAHGPIEKYVADIKDINEKEQCSIFYADPSMWNTAIRKNYGEESPARMFLTEGIVVVPANNKRVNGWRIVKQWMHWSSKRRPKLTITRDCLHTIKTIPINKYNEALKNTEDLDTKGPDDAADALRYLLQTGYYVPLTSEELPNGEEERQEVLMVGDADKDHKAMFKQFGSLTYNTKLPFYSNRNEGIEEELSRFRNASFV